MSFDKGSRWGSGRQGRLALGMGDYLSGYEWNWFFTVTFGKRPRIKPEFALQAGRWIHKTLGMDRSFWCAESAPRDEEDDFLECKIPTSSDEYHIHGLGHQDGRASIRHHFKALEKMLHIKFGISKVVEVNRNGAVFYVAKGIDPVKPNYEMLGAPNAWAA